MPSEQYEAFAREFHAKYGFLAFGKDDPFRPSAETILADLTEAFAENTALRTERDEAVRRAQKAEKRECEYARRCGLTGGMLEGISLRTDVPQDLRDKIAAAIAAGL